VLIPKLGSSFGSFLEVFSLVWTNAGRPVKLRLGGVLALVVTASVLTALGPVALKLIVDRFTAQTGDRLLIPLGLIGLYVMSQWAARAVGQTWGLIYARAERRMFRTLSERLFAHLMRLPLRFHLDRQTGALSQSLNDGLQGYEAIVYHLIFTLVPVAAELVTMILVLSHLVRPTFIALFCGVLMCYALVFAHAAVSVSTAAKMACAAHVDAIAVMTDGILNYETVKYFTAESILQNKASCALSRAEVEWVNYFRRYALRGLATATIFAAFMGITVLYASQDVVSHRMSIGSFILVNSYMLQVVRPVEILGYALQGLCRGVAMLEKMLALFRETAEPQFRDDRIANIGPGKLEFEDVTLSYRPERRVLKSISFTVGAGKTLGIVGASGSGKSSIVRLLVRLLEPDQGRILLDGVPIASLSLSRLRQSIAVVPQDTVLFNDSIGYNIGFGSVSSTQEEIERAATLANLHDFITNLPEKYDTRVGERGMKLSGGEKQRISIARAAMKNPKIYIFDEATSSLDSKTEREILRNLKQISRFSTTLVIAHRLSTVAHADDIIVMEEGAIIEHGTHLSLLRKPGKYAALWAAQQLGPEVAA
jgi:ABC-type transport system involved in Fe-S cluster assembly fused permease/ATPase subunit